MLALTDPLRKNKMHRWPQPDPATTEANEQQEAQVRTGVTTTPARKTNESASLSPFRRPRCPATVPVGP